jgi:hypothetical protein
MNKHIYEIYKNLWKLVFKVENNDCTENRLVNRQILEVIGNLNSKEILEAIKNEKDYYSKISLKEKILDHLVIYLSKNRNIYELLNEDANIKIEHHVNNTNTGKIYGWFLKETLEQYYQEAGRAGRDGNYAEATLLYQQNDWDYWIELQEKK